MQIGSHAAGGGGGGGWSHVAGGGEEGQFVFPASFSTLTRLTTWKWIPVRRRLVNPSPSL